MIKKLTVLFCISLSCVFLSCDNPGSNTSSVNGEDRCRTEKSNINPLRDIIPLYDDGDVNALIEIPSGTLQKWELNKTNGKVEWEQVDDKPRIINYIGYPGNYGMIPKTKLSKEKGGDGDPLDIIVLGPPEERGSIVKCKVIGVLYLLDNGEKDDKLVAISTISPLYTVNSIDELNENYAGVTEIINLWFTNYKGPGKMTSKGYGDRNDALKILNSAINDY